MPRMWKGVSFETNTASSFCPRVYFSTHRPWSNDLKVHFSSSYKTHETSVPPFQPLLQTHWALQILDSP